MHVTWSTHSGGVSEALFGHCAGTAVRPLSLSNAGNCMASAPLAPRNSHACPKTAATSLARVLFGLLTSLQIRLSLNISEGDNTKERKGKEKK